MSAIPHTRSRIPGKIDSKAATSWTPSSLSNVYAWYDPESLELSDNDAVASWPSILETSVTFAQATGSKQPLLKTNIVNGHSVVRFDGIDDTLLSPNLEMTVGNLFFVVRFANSLPDRRFWSQQTTSTGGALMFSGTNFIAVTSGGNVGTPALWTTAALDTWYVLVTEHTATTTSLYVNGTLTGSTNIPAKYDVPILLCGKLLDTYGTCTAADIAMFGIVRGGVLNSSERSTAEDALMTRFGISA